MLVRNQLYAESMVYEAPPSFESHVANCSNNADEL
jgi:hypothetical protein